MNKYITIIKFAFFSALATASSFFGICHRASAEEAQALPSIYEFKVKSIDGQEVSLNSYKGKVLLIVNTASQCGFTPQYEDLEKLYTQYKEKDFEILGFPSNDFGGQEPGSNKEIKSFCKIKFGVTFPLFEKGPVSGDEIQPIFKFLINNANPKAKGSIQWNFEKFIINKEGKLISRFGSFTNPMSGKITRLIDELIAQ